jgi:hypothetical protein
MVKIADISSKPERKKAKRNTKPRTCPSERSWSFIAAELKSQSMNPDFYTLEEFYTNLDIPEQVFYEACRREPEMGAARDFAKIRAGINREKLAIKRGENINTTNSFVLPHYLNRFKEQVEWRQQLKQDLLDNIAKSMQGLKPEDVMGNL